MNETVTLDQLILYLYNETEMADTVLIQQSIDRYPEVAEEFQHLIDARNLINSSLLHASKKSINTILSYAYLTAPLQQQV